MSALIDNNAEYQKVTFVIADWGKFRKAPIRSELAVRRRSTLIMFNEGEEVARVVAQTRTAAIEALFKAVI